jgi:hypothetical protein
MRSFLKASFPVAPHGPGRSEGLRHAAQSVLLLLPGPKILYEFDESGATRSSRAYLVLYTLKTYLSE